MRIKFEVEDKLVKDVADSVLRFAYENKNATGKIICQIWTKKEEDTSVENNENTELMSTEEVEKLSGVDKTTLMFWRKNKWFLFTHTRIGKRVFYRKLDVSEFLKLPEEYRRDILRAGRSTSAHEKLIKRWSKVRIIEKRSGGIF